MACFKCGSTWVTATGKNCASCPHCCKLTRCKERKAGRWVDVIDPRPCIRCKVAFTPGSIQQNSATICPSCKSQHRKEWRKQWTAKYRKHGPTQKQVHHAPMPQCVRCCKDVSDRRHAHCGRDCYNADKKDGTIKWDTTNQQIGSLRKRRAQGLPMPSQVMYAAIKQAIKKHLCGIDQLYRKLNAFRACLRCGGPLKEHANERTKFCSIPCAAEYCHDVSCQKCGKVFIRRGVQGPKSYCHRCKRKAILESKRRHGKNIAKRARRYGVERVPYSREELLSRDGWQCQLCLVPLLKRWTYNKQTLVPHPRNATLDHIVPMSKGGADAPWNIQACCLQCNGKKSASTKGQLRFKG